MAKICEKRVHRNDKKKITLRLQKVSWVTPFYTTLKIVRAQGNSGSFTKEISKRKYSKKRSNPVKGKIFFQNL